MKQYYEALFLSYRPRTECSNLQFGQPVLTLAARAVVECLTACSQRRFLAEHSVAMLNNVVAIRNNVATMLQRCVALKIGARLTSPLRVYFLFNAFIEV